MSKNLFQNSKAALGFAALTLVGAVSMVGTSDNSGMLPKLAQRFANQPPAAQPSEAAAETPPAPPPAKKVVPGWYDTPSATPTAQASVFGDYNRDGLSAGTAPAPLNPTPTSPFQSASTQSAPSGRSGGGPAHAPISPTAVKVN